MHVNNFRPLDENELKLNVPRVITCNENRREVTVSQNVASKQLDRVFTFDKVCMTGPLIFYLAN